MSMPAPTASISVILPVYNGESYLAEAIESVLEQTIPPSEVLLIDDGSTDRSAEIAESYAPRVTTIRQTNGGQPAAHNRGIRRSSGEFIAFQDADDVWEPRRLELELDAFRADPSLDMVFGAVQQFRSPELPAEVARKIICPSEPSQGRAAAAMLLRRASFERVGEFNEQQRIGNFIDWYARAMEAGLRELMLTDVVMRRRLHENNMGRKQEGGRVEYVRLLKSALDRRRGASAAMGGPSA
jgi:glycosyltransferase involved in cell wall biosynthesis